VWLSKSPTAYGNSHLSGKLHDRFYQDGYEGAELEALKGSEMVLRHFRPKLAVCFYHDLEDFWAIPRYLDSLGLGYRLYLRHFTIHPEETVLFADSPKSA
jgi:hypothetical protein